MWRMRRILLPTKKLLNLLKAIDYGRNFGQLIIYHFKLKLEKRMHLRTCYSLENIIGKDGGSGFGNLGLWYHGCQIWVQLGSDLTQMGQSETFSIPDHSIFWLLCPISDISDNPLWN